MRKLFGYVVLFGLVLASGTTGYAAVDRNDRGGNPQGQAVGTPDSPGLSLRFPELFGTVLEWLLGNSEGRPETGTENRGRNPQDSPEPIEESVGGCRSVGGCGGWL